MTRLFAMVEGSNPPALVELKATAQGHLITQGDAAGASSASGAAAEPNWATTFTYTNGVLTLETRTAGDVTQTRAYTYDPVGNLTHIGAWQ